MEKKYKNVQKRRAAHLLREWLTLSFRVVMGNTGKYVNINFDKASCTGVLHVCDDVRIDSVQTLVTCVYVMKRKIQID
jgi:hypothetical protein